MNKTRVGLVSSFVAMAVILTAIFGFSPKAFGLTNVATSGTGYRWYGMTAATDDTNKTAATGINDGNTATDFSLTTSGADDGSNKYEATGVIWSTNKAIVSAKFKNGTYDGNNNGVFAANFSLQYTTDGSTWLATNWTFSPSYQYDTNNASGVEFTFSGSALTVKGLRVAGQVHLSGGNSWFVSARELQAFEDETAPTPTATPTGQTNLANTTNGGTGYRWYGMTSSTADTNKTADTKVNDDDLVAFSSLNNETDDASNKWEAAGVTWASNKTINTISFVQGQYTDDKNGPFGANLKAQYTTDGSTWVDSGWTASPTYAYDNQSEQYKTFTFAGTNTSVRGVRIVGQVHVSSSDGSWFARVNEVIAIGSGTPPATATAFPTNTPFPTNTSTPLPNTPSPTVKPTNTALPAQPTEESYDNAVATREANPVTHPTPAPGTHNVSYTDSGNGIYTSTLPVQYDNQGRMIVVVWPLVFHDASASYASSISTAADAVQFANDTMTAMNDAFKNSGIVFQWALSAPTVNTVIPTGFPQQTNGSGRGDASLYTRLPDCYEMYHYWGGVRQVWMFTDTDAHLPEYAYYGPRFESNAIPYNIRQCGHQITYFGFVHTEKVGANWAKARLHNTLHDMSHFVEDSYETLGPQISKYQPVVCDFFQRASDTKRFDSNSPRNNPDAAGGQSRVSLCDSLGIPMTYTGSFLGRAYTNTYTGTQLAASRYATDTNISGCGSTHWVPNDLYKNDTSTHRIRPNDNQTKVLSGCVGTYPYTQSTEIDCTAWTCDELQMHKWRFQHYSGIGPYGLHDRNGNPYTFSWLDIIFQ